MSNPKEKMVKPVDVKQETPVAMPEVEEQNIFDESDTFYKASVEDPEVEVITDVEVDKEEGAE